LGKKKGLFKDHDPQGASEQGQEKKEKSLWRVGEGDRIYTKGRLKGETEEVAGLYFSREKKGGRRKRGKSSPSFKREKKRW